MDNLKRTLDPEKFFLHKLCIFTKIYSVLYPSTINNRDEN